MVIFWPGRGVNTAVPILYPAASPTNSLPRFSLRFVERRTRCVDGRFYGFFSWLLQSLLSDLRRRSRPSLAYGRALGARRSDNDCGVPAINGTHAGNTWTIGQKTSTLGQDGSASREAQFISGRDGSASVPSQQILCCRVTRFAPTVSRNIIDRFAQHDIA